MADYSKTEYLQTLPLILAGPLLQHTEAGSVTVWVALQQACQVELGVYETHDRGTIIGTQIFQGKRSTIALGKHLHVVAVTARSREGQQLSCDLIYAYDLRFITSDQTEQTLEQALCSDLFPQANLSYFNHRKPTFVLPPTDPRHLKLVHGSCRKPHGDGYDALPILDCLIEQAADQPEQRPHQLFLTGDQIYADDVADPLLWVASQIGDRLLGWDEKLPIGPKEPADVNYYTPSQLPFGRRAEVATRQAGFTAGLRNKPAKVNSHLFSLGEYCASYLLAWSPVCWLTPFPQGRQMIPNRKVAKRWDQEAQDMEQFIHTMGKVRRALANIPVYTIFDDHDVSDDWNLNQAWCLRVYGRPLGRRAVQNALLAYAFFQAWGNTPHQFEADQPGAKLLEAAQSWSASEGQDRAAYDAIARYLGMPSIDPHTGLPNFVQDGNVMVFDRHAEAIKWHYTIQSACHEVIVLDTRTWRGYPADASAIAPPMLLSPKAFEQQLLQPLQRSGENSNKITFVIAPTNLFELQVIDWIHHRSLKQNKVFATDVGDAWNINYEALARFLSTLFKQRDQVVVLSGDIHYSAAVKLSHTQTGSFSNAVLVQLTASAFKNKELITQIINTRLKNWLLPEKVRRWAGWDAPFTMAEIPSKRSNQKSTHPLPPDWYSALEWIPRKPSQTPEFGHSVEWLVSPVKRKTNARWQWLQRFMFWQSRWFQDGREVVGMNNVALVQLNREDDRPFEVIQDVYWYSSWHPDQIVYSRYQCPLTPNQSLLNQDK